MLEFGQPIKHKIVYLNSDGDKVSSTLTCVNQKDGLEILKSIPKLDFQTLISFSKLDDCGDCRL